MDGRLDVLLGIARVSILVRQSFLEVFFRKRLVEKESLDCRTFGVLQEIQLLRIFDTFGNDFEIKLVNHVHHVSDDNFVMVSVFSTNVVE